jgi:hypothetical protein
VKCYVFDGGNRQMGMAREPHCAVADEAGAMAVVAGKVQAIRWLPLP